MAYDFKEMNDRARHRDLAQRRREQLQKRRLILRWITFGAVMAVGILILIVALARKDPADPSAETTTVPTTTTTVPTQTTTVPPTTTVPTEPETVIRLVFGGDVNVTDKVVAAGNRDGSFDYTQLLLDIAPLFADAHAAFLNLEGGFYGAPFGSASFSAPQALADAFAAAGVDMIQLANSRSIAGGLAGLSATMDAVRAAGMYPLGVFSPNEAHQGYTLVNIGGIRVAIVAFTKGMDGMSLPAGSEGCVNLLYTDYATTSQTVDEEGITRVLQAAQAQAPDLTIAMVHWGSEYNDTISPTQKTIVELMQGLGVDAIVGTHSHFVQKVDYNEEKGTVVAYSLGDLLGDAEKAGTNYSILLQLEITRDNLTGQTRITGCDYTGVYVLTPEKDALPLQILRITPALSMYENNHIGRISDLAYENMLYAWKRIQARVTG